MAQAPFPFAGELASLGAAAIWSVSTTIYARHGGALSAAALNLWKNVIAFVCLVVLAFALGLEWPRDPTLYAWLGASGLIGLAVGDTALFAALKRLGPQLTTSIQCLSPPISALVAAIYLGEHLSVGETAGMLVTAVATGALVYMNGTPKSRAEIAAPAAGKRFAFGVGFAMFAALCQGAQIVISRFALATIPVIAGTAMRIGPAVTMLIVMYSAQRFQTPTRPSGKMPLRSTILLGIAAFMGTFIGLLLMSAGAKYTKAGVTAALTSTYPIWVMVISRYVLKERLSPPRVLMTILAVAGVIILVTTG